MAIPLTAAEPIEFTPVACFENPAKRDVKIHIRVPTMMERDRYSAALVRSGVIFYTQQQLRDFTLAGVQEVYPPEKHEEFTALIEEMWMVMDAEREANERQGAKLIEIYEKAKAQKKEPDPKKVQAELDKIIPNATMDKQRRVKATGIVSEIAAHSIPVRDALAALTEADSRRAYLNVQTFVFGWEGLEHTLDAPPGPTGMKQHEAEYLRLQIGEEAWEELSDKITALQGLTEDEEKNSDSPPANTPDETGSTQLGLSKESNASGDSTVAPSTSTRANGSPTTTASSSRSMKKAATKTGS